MPQTLPLSDQVQKAIAQLKALLKSKQEFDEQAVQLHILKELLQEQEEPRLQK